jgi:hypothetical protein
MASKVEAKIDKLLEMTSRLDERHQNTAKDIEAIQVSLTLQNGRIGKLEQWKSKMTGIAAAGVPIISFAVSWVQHKLEGK